jgi:antibiotic biosynthesis monooxygenase (ABM) superfamily enzyme
MITRIVRLGREVEYRRWLSDVLAAAYTFPNHLGLIVLAPTADDATIYRFVHRFTDQHSLQAWENSDAYRQLKVEADKFSDARGEEAPGMTAWFAVSGMSPTLSPPKWKTTILIFLIVYGLTALLIPLQVQWIPHSWPFLLSNAILNGVIAVVMIYVLMPIATWLLRRWLR